MHPASDWVMTAASLTRPACTSLQTRETRRWEPPRAALKYHQRSRITTQLVTEQAANTSMVGPPFTSICQRLSVCIYPPGFKVQGSRFKVQSSRFEVSNFEL